jgi:predicted transcriptional regulator
VKGYFEGSAAKLVSQFVSDKTLSLQELEELLQQIRKAKKSKP